MVLRVNNSSYCFVPFHMNHLRQWDKADNPVSNDQMRAEVYLYFLNYDIKYSLDLFWIHYAVR